MVYPCEIDIKVFGKTNDKLEMNVQEVLLQHLETSQIIAIRSKQSNKGNYQSLSCKVLIDSKDQADRVFIKLNAHPDVVMVL